MALRSLSSLTRFVLNDSKKSLMDHQRHLRRMVEVYDHPSGPHSVEQINSILGLVSQKHRNHVSLLRIFHQTKDGRRSAVKGIRVSKNRPQNQKHIMVVSGLPLQDPSAVLVNLYAASMLASSGPLSRPVSFLPLVCSSYYNGAVQSSVATIATHDEPMVKVNDGTISASSSIKHAGGKHGIAEFVRSLPPDDVSLPLNLGDVLKPLEGYIARSNKFVRNIEVDISQNSFASNPKKEGFVMLKNRRSRKPALPEFVAANSAELYDDPVVGSLVRSPAIVLELRCNTALNDDEAAARGEKLVAMIRSLVAQDETLVLP